MEDSIYPLINNSIFDVNGSETYHTTSKSKEGVINSFASILINEMLQCAQKSSHNLSDHLINSDSVNFTNKLYLNQLAVNITKNDNLGIKRALLSNLTNLGDSYDTK